MIISAPPSRPSTPSLRRALPQASGLPPQAALSPELVAAIDAALERQTERLLLALAEPKSATPLPPRGDLAQLGSALGKVVLPGLAAGTAGSAYALSRMPMTSTAGDLAKLLASHHVPAAEAEATARNVLAALNNPWAKGVLLTIAAGAATAVVVQQTDFPLRKKVAYVAGAMALLALGLGLLYTLGGRA